MKPTNIVKAVAVLVVLPLLVVAWQERDTVTGWLIPAKDVTGADTKALGSDSPGRVKLSPQAQKNLRLVVKETNPTTYWKKIYLPGTVIDRPGHSDRGIPAPIAGVVTWVNAIPGK